jgi:splicing factor 3A subunit 2
LLLQIECRLCLTLHNNEGNYLAHTQVQQQQQWNAAAVAAAAARSGVSDTMQSAAALPVMLYP